MPPHPPRIVIPVGASGRLKHTLRRGTTRVGRRPDTDIRVDDPTVSGLHAQIIWIYDPPYVQDLGSTNGTFVNGVRVGRQTLRDGDVIRVGRQDLIFRWGAPGGNGASVETPVPGERHTTPGDTLTFEQVRALVSDARAGLGPPIPTEIHWVAQDAAGVWWGFEHRPHAGGSGWRELDLSSFVKLGRGRANPNWRDSIRKI